MITEKTRFDIVIFNGFQERKNKSSLPMFTDTKTGTTFLVSEDEEIIEALKRKRVQFGVS